MPSWNDIAPYLGRSTSRTPWSTRSEAREARDRTIMPGERNFWSNTGPRGGHDRGYEPRNNRFYRPDRSSHRPFDPSQGEVGSWGRSDRGFMPRGGEYVRPAHHYSPYLLGHNAGEFHGMPNDESRPSGGWGAADSLRRHVR